jgi:hypothetical protein
MSHLNAVTVLFAAFAARGSELKSAANQADSNIPQRFRAVPLNSELMCQTIHGEMRFPPRDATGQR